MKAKLYVNEGRVQCPRRGDVDVDVCLTCPELHDVRTDRNGEDVIFCTPAIRPTRLDPLYTRW